MEAVELEPDAMTLAGAGARGLFSLVAGSGE